MPNMKNIELGASKYPDTGFYKTLEKRSSTLKNLTSENKINSKQNYSELRSIAVWYDDNYAL